jgi:hypothetical protein
LALPLDNYKLLNFLNFNDVGANSIQEMNAFKKIRMFSKTYTSNLVYLPNDFSNKYKTLSNLYINDSAFYDSYLYGLKRQHNFLSANALLNNQSTFLDFNSVNKFINFNFKNTLKTSTPVSYTYKPNLLRKYSNEELTSASLYLSYLLYVTAPQHERSSLNTTLTYADYISSINDNTDKTKTHYPVQTFFHPKHRRYKFNNFSNVNKLNFTNDLNLIDFTNEVRNNIFDGDYSYKNISASSSNQSVLIGNRYVRNFIKNSPSVPSLNYSMNLNTMNDYLNISKSTLGLNNTFLNDLNTSN